MGNNRLHSAVTFKKDDDAVLDGASGYCDACDAKMTLLGTLPAIRLRSAIHVFRCFACNSVISHEI